MKEKASNPFYRLVSPGSIPYEVGAYGSGMMRLFVEIEYRDGRLSIVGVEGPKSNGDCKGGCGQVGISIDIQPNAEEGWDAGKVGKLRMVWDRWHLNDMRAGCKHQRKAWNTQAPIEVVSYRLSREGWELKKEAEKEAFAAAREGRDAGLSDTGKALLAKDVLLPAYSPPDADSPLSGLCEVEKRETKAAGWVYPSEHPDGLLMKPCEVCGYKYGSAWLKEPVPSAVLGFLRRLKDTNYHYAWAKRG